MYYATYADAYLVTLSERLRTEQASGAQAWCIFDNTATHAAWDDAGKLRRMLRGADMPGAGSRRRRADA